MSLCVLTWTCPYLKAWASGESVGPAGGLVDIELGTYSTASLFHSLNYRRGKWVRVCGYVFRLLLLLPSLTPSSPSSPFHIASALYDYKGTLHKDPMAAVKRIYTELGYTLSATSETKMVEWLAENGRGKHGKNTYKSEWFGFDTHKAALQKYGGLRKYDDYYCNTLFLESEHCNTTD